MNAVDIIVLLLLAAAVALVIRRNLRKGVPCEGGGFVQVVMKWDGFEWMPEAALSATANNGTEGE